MFCSSSDSPDPGTFIGGLILIVSVIVFSTKGNPKNEITKKGAKMK